MIFWIIATLMVVGAVAALVLPLLRPSVAATSEAAYDLEVYRDQLTELERDHARGVISAEEMDAARSEIARRMLAADARLQKGAYAKSTLRASTMLGIAGVLAVVIAAGSVFTYLQIGNPGAPDMPLAQRDDLNAPAGGGQDFQKQLADLRRSVEANPDDAQGWLHLAGVYRSVDMYSEAAEAYRKAVALGPVSTEVNGDYAEVMLMAAQGAMTPEIRSVFEEILAAEPTDPRALFYLARADYQAGKTQEALDRWAKLISSSPADAPWLPIVRENLTRAAEDLGLDVAEVMPEPLPAAERGGEPALTPEQRAELEAMTPAEREEMIRGMVEGLDARLRNDPMDLGGWKRLIRARAMLDEPDAAQDALNRAMEVFASAPAPTQQLVELGRELQLDIPQDTSDTPNIGQMVEGLAARMQENPDDLEGWIMLGRSYTVLGETEKAREALENAARLAPDNPDVLALQAGTIRAANGGKDDDKSVAILRRVLELAPNHPEALWFLGNAEAEAGNNDKARTLLEHLLGQIPEGNPQKELVQQRIDELGG